MLFEINKLKNKKNEISERTPVPTYSGSQFDGNDVFENLSSQNAGIEVFGNLPPFDRLRDRTTPA